MDSEDVENKGVKNRSFAGCSTDGGRKEGRNGDTVSRTLVGDYRIRYYLSSEKLRTVD